MAGRTCSVGRAAGGTEVGAVQAPAAQGAAGDLGDPAAQGQAEGQDGRDQQLDGDAGEEQAAVHGADQRDPGRGPLDQLLDQVDGDLEQRQTGDPGGGQAARRPAGPPARSPA